MKTKICSKCDEWKEESEFHKDKSKKDGLKGQCKKCKDLKTKEYRENNKEKIKECQKEYYKNNKNKIKKICKKI